MRKPTIVELRRLESRKLLDDRFNWKLNSIRVHRSNGYVHELAKFNVCWILSKRGHAFVTEAIFKTGARADILDLDNHVAYEILNTETMTELWKKIEKYPVKVIPIIAKREISEKDI